MPHCGPISENKLRVNDTISSPPWQYLWMSLVTVRIHDTVKSPRCPVQAFVSKHCRISDQCSMITVIYCLCKSHCNLYVKNLYIKSSCSDHLELIPSLDKDYLRDIQYISYILSLILQLNNVTTSRLVFFLVPIIALISKFYCVPFTHGTCSLWENRQWIYQFGSSEYSLVRQLIVNIKNERKTF